VVLIFGWGRGPADDRGEVAPLRCPNCHNDVFFHRIRSTKQVSLFFVPVVPYGTDEYLVCPVCGRGLQIPPGHQAAVEGMRVATTAYRAGRIAQADYTSRSDAFWRSMGITTPAGAPPGEIAAVGQDLGAAGAPHIEPSLADRLADLARLHAEGILTDEEFRAAKRHILGDQRGTQARQEGAEGRPA
jgi:hypothetical protein